MNLRFLRILNIKKYQYLKTSRHGYETLLLIIGAILVALVVFIFAITVAYILKLSQFFYSHYFWTSWILLPFGLAFIAWTTQKYMPYISGGGIPQVIAAMHVQKQSSQRKLLHLCHCLLKIPLICLAIFFGASIGREGPSVQIGAAIMLAWGQWCRQKKLAFRELKDSSFIAIGGAAGVAAAFNTPLAGVIFAIEELGRGKAIRWDRQILIGVVAAGLLIISIQGNNPYFPYIGQLKQVNYPFLWGLLIAITCGISGGYFAKMIAKGFIYYLPKFMQPFFKKHSVIVAFTCGLLLALIGYFYQGQTFGSGYALVTDSIQDHENSSENTLALGKWLASIISQWSLIPGGIFTPSLSIGAVIGENISHFLGTDIAINFLVLLSMAAFLAAVTQSPLTASVIVIEMTGSMNMLFWCMLCAICASMISRQISPKALYLLGSQRYGTQLEKEKDC